MTRSDYLGKIKSFCYFVREIVYGVDESCSQSLPGCLGKLYRCRYESEEFWLKKSVSEVLLGRFMVESLSSMNTEIF